MSSKWACNADGCNDGGWMMKRRDQGMCKLDARRRYGAQEVYIYIYMKCASGA